MDPFDLAVRHFKAEFLRFDVLAPQCVHYSGFFDGDLIAREILKAKVLPPILKPYSSSVRRPKQLRRRPVGEAYLCTIINHGNCKFGVLKSYLLQSSGLAAG